MRLLAPLLLLLIFFIPVLPVLGQNLVLNPGFESGVGGDADSWVEGVSQVGSGTVLASFVGRSLYGSSYVMNMTGWVVSPNSFGRQELFLTIDQTFTSQPVNVSNVSFTYVVEALSIQGSGYVFLRIHLYDQGATAFSSTITVSQPGTYTFYSDVYKNADSIKIEIQLRADYALAGQSHARAKIYIDNVSVYEAPSPPPPPPQPTLCTYVENVSEPTGHTFRVCSTDVILNASWDDVKKDLSYVTSGNSSVYVGKWGVPQYIYVDGVVYTAWTYVSENQTLLLSGLPTNASVTLDWPEPFSGGGGGGGGGGAPPQAADDPGPPPVYSPEPRLPITEGVLVLLLVVGSVFAYRYLKRLEQRRSLALLFSKKRRKRDTRKLWKRRLKK